MTFSKLSVLMLGSALALAACSEHNQTAGTESGTTTAASAASSSAPVNSSVDLRSSDGKISVRISGDFSDKSADADLMPVNVDKDKLKLLQQDSITGTTIYVVHTGSTKDANAYFTKLKAAIESDKSLKNVKVGTASANRMDYQFSQVDDKGDVTLNEQCIALMAGEQIYTVCANNPESNQEELEAALSSVSVVTP